ncbi:AMIN-like domain-containing (lipo)protein [Corynebacterium comes]|uniref:AMIN-like domain-containing protein n=1 Tax=Corynebacterium comes TaxID=2675218 RepID=A0A6B8W1Q4_9CORY|nr:hypothetical protein [Corynebacterium comes]QGU04856.1 hypothetical protein CETAM_08010 [Corynebacterium comes]
MTAYRRPLVPVALTVAALLLVACGDGGGYTAPSSDTAPPSQASATERPLGQPDLAPKTREVTGTGNPTLLENIRSGRHQGFDRVVFDLSDGEEPGWRVDYVDEAMQQASGLPVDVEGDALLHVVITNTTYPFELGIEDPFEPGTYPGAGVVNEVAYTGIFEGHTESYIGLDRELPYSVTLLSNPTRLVIDVEHLPG